VTVHIDSPTGRVLLAAGRPVPVSVSADSANGHITSVSLRVDQNPAVPMTGNWTSSVTFDTAGQHTLEVEAQDSLGKRGGATETVTVVLDTPLLTCLAPTTGPRGITTTTISFDLQVHVQTLSDPSAIRAVEYTLAPTANPPRDSISVSLSRSSPGDRSFQGTVTLPSTQVATYTLTVSATTDEPRTGTLVLGVVAVDTTKPEFLDEVIATHPGVFIQKLEGAVLEAGSTPTVTLEVSDQPAGVVTSGVATVSVQLDAQPAILATRSAPGDPSFWTATLPVITHADHTVTIVATDVQGNSLTELHKVTVALTSWTRLEPAPRDPTLMEGLQAKIADPLWLLARQAAFGEFAGEDTASPVAVRLRARASSITRLRSARSSGAGWRLPTDGGPLEALALADPAASTDPGALFGAQAGLHYLRLLGAAPSIGDLTGYRRGLITAYPLPAPSPPDPRPGGRPPAQASDPPLAPYAGRVPDGVRLYAELAAALRPPGPGSLPTAPPLAGADPTAVTRAANTWLTWYDAVSGQVKGAGQPTAVPTPDGWSPERLEYSFDIAAPGPAAETVLTTSEVVTGDLDWLDFDVLASSSIPPAIGTSLGAVPADLPSGDAEITSLGLPTPIAFRGMPNGRWWDFEDAGIDFGAITAPVESVTTSLIVEFALRYGNDHFIIPVRLDVGSVCRVDSLVVLNTYGEVLRIQPVSVADGGNGPFRLFEHTIKTADGATARDPLFVLFPTLDHVLSGPPIEEVHFARDEAAEIVWAIEQTAPDSDGIPSDRTAEALAQFTASTPTASESGALPTPRYITRTDVERNWFPFLLPDPATSTTLSLADVPPLDAAFPPPLPWGKVLAPYLPSAPHSGPLSPGVAIPQEEVTRAGVQIVRRWRYARWINGAQLSWIERQVRPGRGPAASGLTFDLAT
jgi:hypothetical protein